MRRFTAPKRANPSNAAWQTIYMDLMTIVMVFFVILWSINQGKDVGVSETVGDVVARTINLPGDVLFSPGKTDLRKSGKEVFKTLFQDDSGEILNFETGGLVKRLLVIHGHTDSTGSKNKNFQLGYSRAFSAYQEILKYSSKTADHIVLCTHADNSPDQEVPKFSGRLSKIQREAIRNASAKNRRITIEDKLVNAFQAED